MDPILIALIPLFYFLPSLVDSIINHEIHGYISLVNLMLGWTLFYWLVCFYWVFRDFFQRKEKPYTYSNPHARHDR